MPQATGSGGASVVKESGETASPWLAILRTCSVVTGIAAVLLALVAWIIGGPAAAGSALGSVVVVIIFFGISLAIGHLVGRRNPSAAFGAFMIGYVVKVVLLGGLAFGLGLPAWTDGTWLLVGVVSAVVIWQVVELHAFSKLRLQLYNDPIPATDAGTGGA
ncbi:hypothetical protein [Arthrobacter rhombi]|nr:hypothetical protein [Arthrobacter rhombi]